MAATSDCPSAHVSVSGGKPVSYTHLFKSVNDTLGHQYGDDLLRQLARRLAKNLREQDTLARLGGDEFAVVLPGIDKTDDLRQMAQRLIDAVREPFQVDGHTCLLYTSRCV